MADCASSMYRFLHTWWSNHLLRRLYLLHQSRRLLVGERELSVSRACVSFVQCWYVWDECESRTWAFVRLCREFVRVLRGYSRGRSVWCWRGRLLRFDVRFRRRNCGCRSLGSIGWRRRLFLGGLVLRRSRMSRICLLGGELSAFYEIRVYFGISKNR